MWRPRQFISHYTTPPQKMLSRDLTARLNKQIDFLAECRPLAVAMGNAIKHLKMHVQHLDPGLPEERAKAILTDTIDNFIMVQNPIKPHRCLTPSAHPPTTQKRTHMYENVYVYELLVDVHGLACC